MKIKAKFKGSNSLGYENGLNYWLDFTTTSNDQILIEPLSASHLKIERCLYDSLKAFLNNWQVF